MSHNITVNGGTTVRLPTRGKYCVQDILVTATGGGITLNIVTATALPDTVEDGQIVVITNTYPGMAYIDTDMPESNASGDVWIRLESGTDVALELTTESTCLRAGLANASQWDGAEWKNVDAYLGVESAWERFSYSLPPVGTKLEDMTWEDISKIALAGRGKDYFSIGDKKAVAIDGTVGSVRLNGTYYCAIIGIDHNEHIEGKGIHFQFVWADDTDATPYAFDSSYSGTDSTYYMHKTTASVGWANSYMRNTLCAAFLSALPEDVQAAIRPTTKYTNNVGATSAETAVTATNDAVFILSAYEVAGSQSVANSYEDDYQEQYAYYAAGNSIIKKRINNKSNSCNWWTRSPGRSTAKTFVGISIDGKATAYIQNYNYGFAPAFRV